MALSESEVDEAEPFDSVMEWLELLDFRVRMTYGDCRTNEDKGVHHTYIDQKKKKYN